MISSQIISPTEIRLFEIGRIHSPFKQATGTPIQPCRAGNSPGYVTLCPDFADGLEDLAGFDRIWLIYWFHRAAAAKMSVVPYRDTWNAACLPRAFRLAPMRSECRACGC